MDKKILSMLSISKRAGKVVAGELSCEKALQAKKAKLVLIGVDASQNTKKKFVNKSLFYKVPCYELFDKETLSHAIGTENKVVFAVTDEGLAQKLIEHIQAGQYKASQEAMI